MNYIVSKVDDKASRRTGKIYRVRGDGCDFGGHYTLKGLVGVVRSNGSSFYFEDDRIQRDMAFWEYHENLRRGKYVESEEQ